MKKQAAEGDKNAVPNVITYSAAINSCAHTGEWRRSLDLLDAMQREGLRPDRIAYNSVLNACRTGGAPREALGVWDSMIDRAGIKPDIISAHGDRRRGGARRRPLASDRVFTRAVLEESSSAPTFAWIACGRLAPTRRPSGRSMFRA